MESEEKRRKTEEARREYEYARWLGIMMGKMLFVIGLALLFLALAWNMFFFPLAVLCFCLGATFYITSKYEKWFYPKRKTKPQ